jgi:hypothetical protein
VKLATQQDARDELAALRLGWGVAELRGRNRPAGPVGDVAQLPDGVDHPLPLRIERSPTQLRIEVQCVVAALARELHVDHSDDHPSFGQALDDKAKLLGHTRAPAASAALQRALRLLEADDVATALAALRAGQIAQRAVVADRMAVVAAAKKARAAADEELAAAREHRVQELAAAARRAAEDLRVDMGTLTGEARGLAALDEVISTLEKSNSATVGIESIQQRQHAIATDAAKLWASLAELIWEFDAHVQDGLTAASETNAIAYQLGRGLAETYWALDPDAPDGTRSWQFLLGDERCSELSRLLGRLTGYLHEYTGPAIAGSVEVWKDVVKTPAWFGKAGDTQEALYRQIRRWFELLVLGQDPTTLVRPGAVTRDYRALLRAVRLFWPQLVGIAVGLGFLIALLILVNVGSAPPWAKTLSGILGFGGLSLAGLSVALKNSAQAMLKRWRQDSYTDLVAIAVQTAPRPPKKSDLQDAIRRRTLTPATPN